jgi:hydrogenase expression/formation protein HypE
MSDEIRVEGWSCPAPIAYQPTIQMGHGSGGRMMNDLISSLFKHHFCNTFLDTLDDGATLTLPGQRLAFATDSYVVDPIFFPGGNIGDLAVNGTINDLCMCGATPLYLSAGFIIEEGFPLDELEQIVITMANAAKAAQVMIVTGDTKVVDKGKADRIFINTSGIGVLSHSHTMGSHHLLPGDVLLLSGFLGDHGMAVLSQRQNLGFSSTITSDTASLHGLTARILEHSGPYVHAMRDPTRGGLASVLNEFAQASGVSIELEGADIPVRPEVTAACDLLGLDPLYIANEGKMVIAVSAEKAESTLELIRDHPLGRSAKRIGKVCEGNPGLVTMRTMLGGWRVLDMLASEPLPRIC